MSDSEVDLDMDFEMDDEISLGTTSSDSDSDQDDGEVGEIEGSEDNRGTVRRQRHRHTSTSRIPPPELPLWKATMKVMMQLDTGQVLTSM